MSNSSKPNDLLSVADVSTPCLKERVENIISLLQKDDPIGVGFLILFTGGHLIPENELSQFKSSFLKSITSYYNFCRRSDDDGYRGYPQLILQKVNSEYYHLRLERYREDIADFTDDEDEIEQFQYIEIAQDGMIVESVLREYVTVLHRRFYDNCCHDISKFIE